MQDMEEARKEKVTEEHKVIDEAIRDRGDGYTVFSIVSARFLAWPDWSRLSHIIVLCH
jgi:hypothetical protein